MKKELTWADITRLAEEMGVEPAALAAVRDVEARGSGFLYDGRPKILFEPHVFWKQLKHRRYNPAGLLSRADVRAAHGDISDILYKNQDVRPYGTEAAQYGRLNRARTINDDAALASASWGAFQVMGYHAVPGPDSLDLGWPSLIEFVRDMDETMGQTEAFVRYIKKSGLVPALKAHDWAAFARGYNGPGYAKNRYDLKMRLAYEKCAGGR